MNLQTIKLNMLNDLKGIERGEITKDRLKPDNRLNDEDMQNVNGLSLQNGEINSSNGSIQVGFL